MKQFFGWLASLLLLLAWSLPCVAQYAGQSDDVPEGPKFGHTPALEYTVALLFTALVMVILCKPSRKA